MNEHDERAIREALKQTFPPVNTELGRDLWPAVLRRLDARPTPHGLNPLAGGRIVLCLPLRNDVIAGPDFQQLPKNQGPALRGGLF